MGISTAQLYLVTSCESPKDVWDTLRSHFERDTLANKLFLKKKYFRKEMKASTSVEVHLKEMKELTDKLAAAICEEDQVVTLLGSLPSSYSVIVTALQARVDDISLNYVQQALIHEEQKHTDTVKSDQSHDSALVGGRRDGPRRPPVCWNCQEVGHVQRYCPKGKYTVNPHKASAAEHGAEESEVKESAFTVQGDVSSHERWIVDSGATSHMTFRKDLLHDYQEFDVPEKVGLGDGRIVDAVGTGAICLNMQFKVSNSKRHKVLYVPKLVYFQSGLQYKKESLVPRDVG